MSSLFQKVLQLFAAARMAQLAQRLRLNLTDTLTRYAKVLAHFLQGAAATVLQAKAQLKHTFFARGQGLQNLVQLLTQQRKASSISRRRRIMVLNKIAKMRILFLTNRRLQGNRLLRNLHNLAHSVHRGIHFLSNLLGQRLASQLLQQLAGYANQLINRLHHMHRNTNRAGLVGNRAGNSLTNPPCSIGTKLKALIIVKFFYCLDQS